MDNLRGLPSFTPQARQRWERLPADMRDRLLANVYCPECHGETTIVDYRGSVMGGMLILQGRCKRCGSDVARAVE